MNWSKIDFVIPMVILLFLITAMTGRAQEDRYDPTTDPNVQSYLVCIQLSSGGGDNSNLPDAETFDEKGYVQWANGTTKAIVCQDVDKVV